MNWTVTPAKTGTGDRINNLYLLWVDGKIAAKLFIADGRVYAAKTEHLEKGESGNIKLESLGLEQSSILSEIKRIKK